MENDVFLKGLQVSDDVGVGNSNWKRTGFLWILGVEVQ
jgi:hypothetical protein